MKSAIVAAVAAVVSISALAAGGKGATEGGYTASHSRSVDPITPVARGNIDAMREVIKHVHRDNIITTTKREMNTSVTSADRPSTSKIASSSHDRGATDFSVRHSRDVGADASRVAQRLGPGYTVIHEVPSGNVDRHTSYKVSGAAGTRREVVTNSYNTPRRATAEHLHIQPNYGTGIKTSAEAQRDFENRLRRR